MDRRRGRPGKYAAFEELEASLPAKMTKRPLYLHGVGLFRGERGTTVFLKINLRRGGVFRGKSYAPGKPVEIKVGSKESWPWEKLLPERDRLQGLADRGEPLEPEAGVSFATHAEAWLARKKPTVRGYGVLKGHVRGHLIPTFGAKSLADITLADVNGWTAKQRETLKPHTVKRQMNTFKAILNDAVRNRLLQESPTRHADTIKGAMGRMRVLSDEELRAVLKAADKFEAEASARVGPQEIKGWIRDFILWALHSGMRRGEILNLRLGDFRDGPSGSTLVLVERSKSDQPRVVPCDKDMLAIRDRLAKLARGKDDDRLFPVSLTTAKRKMTRLWKACGLDDVRLHDLRRTHASVLINAGGDVRSVADRLGHRDLAMLEKHYAVSMGSLDLVNKTQDAFGELS